MSTHCPTPLRVLDGLRTCSCRLQHPTIRHSGVVNFWACVPPVAGRNVGAHRCGFVPCPRVLLWPVYPRSPAIGWCTPEWIRPVPNCDCISVDHWCQAALCDTVLLTGFLLCMAGPYYTFPWAIFTVPFTGGKNLGCFRLLLHMISHYHIPISNIHCTLHGDQSLGRSGYIRGNGSNHRPRGGHRLHSQADYHHMALHQYVWPHVIAHNRAS